MASGGLTRTRAEHESRLGEQRLRAERAKNLIVLILHHLQQIGYAATADALSAESGVSGGQYEVADNIELLQVLQEFEDYYEMRFARRPRLVRKLSKFSDDVSGPGSVPGLPKINAGGRGGKRSATTAPAGVPRPSSRDEGLDDGSSGRNAAVQRGRIRPDPSGKENAAMPRADERGRGGGAAADATGLDVRGVAHGKVTEAPVDEDPWEHRVRKAGLPVAMAANAELRELASWLQRDMIQRNPNVRWDDIAELGDVKRVLKESLVMPLRYPEYFTGLLQPWKGVLLFGPPGTGKTLLAKAVATECNTTFFNISASSIVSKWRGDSEKLVRVLFELARHHAPSTIFIDEIDALMGSRGDGEHEGSRRLKTELLVQLDGLLSSSEQVFLLAATNLPWELDMALLRRLEKRVLVPFPTVTARESIIRRLLPAERLESASAIQTIAERTSGYSGSDLALVCKEAAMHPLRRLLAQIDTNSHPKHAVLPQPGPVTANDIQAALAAVRPSVSILVERYAEWEREFGSV